MKTISKIWKTVFGKSTTHQLITPKNAEEAKKLLALKNRFAGATVFLKNTMITKQGKKTPLLSLPCYLFIGPSGSGKTSLLANADVPYVLNKKFKSDIPPSQSCDWWATRDAVIIDTPGSYENNTWNQLIELLKKHHQQQPLQAVMISLPIAQFIKYPDSLKNKKMVLEVKQKIQQLQQSFGETLPCYFVITKCDLIPGFLPFFSESSATELTQAWGIPIPALKENQRQIDFCLHRFNALIKNINKQLIWRLHQERNPNLRPLIKDFPLQLERLKETLAIFLKSLALPHLNIAGIYLTSATQTTQDESAHLPQVINSTPQQALQLLRNPTLPSRAYFIRQFILQGLLTTQHPEVLPITAPHSLLRQYAIYAASITTIVAASLLMGRDFQQSIVKTYAIQHSISQYQLVMQQNKNNHENLLSALPLLNSLQATAQQTSQKNILSFYSNQAQQTTQKIYQQALQNIVIFDLKKTFENYLHAPDSKNPEKTYSVLSAYLMLSEPNSNQTNKIINTIQQLLPTQLSKQDHTDLQKHIETALQQRKPMELNQDSILQARRLLTHLPNHELALIILKNNSDNNTNPLNLAKQLGNSSNFIQHDMTHDIPSMYTADAFQNIMTRDIPLAATEAAQGNKVLGEISTSADPAMMEVLVDQLRAQYLENYISTWENLLAGLTLTTPQNLAQTDAMIASLMSNTSPLLQLLKTINQHTSFPDIMSTSAKLRSLNTLLTSANDTQQNTLYRTFIHLRGLHTYLQTILTNNDIGKAAFQAAKTRMQQSDADPIQQLHNLATQQAEPMKTWLSLLSEKSWYFLLQEASRYIENAWELNVLTLYHTYRKDQEIDLTQFADLTGKQGLLANFHQEYLKPFIDDSSKEWRWRTLSEQTIPFSKTALTQLQQATKLQTISKYALFSQGRTNPLVTHFQLPEQLGEGDDFA